MEKETLEEICAILSDVIEKMSEIQRLSADLYFKLGYDKYMVLTEWIICARETLERMYRTVNRMAKEVSRSIQ